MFRPRGGRRFGGRRVRGRGCVELAAIGRRHVVDLGVLTELQRAHVGGDEPPIARRHLFARQFVNTGRMAVANSYTQSGICAPTGGLSVQNVGLRWADGSAGQVNDLLRWAEGRLLVLLFGTASHAALQRLRALGMSGAVRCVQVLGPTDPAGAIEHVRDPQGHVQGACHVFGHAWALVRPDSYVAATGESVDGALVQAISQALGLEKESA